MITFASDWDLMDKVHCDSCRNNDMCDQLRYVCPRIDFMNALVYDEEGEVLYAEKH